MRWLLQRWTARGYRHDVADFLAILLAVSMPWSTSATAIIAAIWFAVVLTALDFTDVRREAMSAAGGLPLLLWLVAFYGMFWADVGWAERFNGLNAFHKLLAIPLLLAQFRRSPNGWWVLAGFLASSALLLAVSTALVLLPGLTWRGKSNVGVPVKDYISQSGIFTLCIFALVWAGLDRVRRPVLQAAALALAALFLANIVYVVTARTALVVVILLAFMFVLKRFHWKGLIALGLLGGLAAAGFWQSSPYLRDRVISLRSEVHKYATDEATDQTSAALRLEFWRKSLGFIAQAPLTGHGTGSVTELFAELLAGETGIGAIPSANPHNQTMMIAIQLGVFGVLALYAMWLAHLLLFLRTMSLPGWIGLTVVVQNIVSSLFNSHLSDFSQGWVYVLGVGLAGGMVRGAQSVASFPVFWRQARWFADVPGSAAGATPRGRIRFPDLPSRRTDESGAT